MGLVECLTEKIREMKRLFLALIALVAIVSCSKNEVLDGVATAPAVVTASFEDTRVAVDNETLKLSWSVDDCLSVFTSTANDEYKYTGSNNEFAAVGAAGEGQALPNNYAVYPYNANIAVSGEGVISLTLPATQNYAEGSFGLGANTMVAVSKSTNFPFQNVCGYIRLNLWGNVKVKSIEFKGNNGEVLAGAATVVASVAAEPEVALAENGSKSIVLDCGAGVELGASAEEATPFWLVVPAQEFEKGFTIIVTDVDGDVMKKSTSITREVVRNQVNTMATFQVVPELGGDVIFDAQFNADGTATDKGKYAMEIVAKPGAGMATVADADYPYGNVVKFTNGPSNSDFDSGFYLVGYADNAEFRNDLADGFTMEVVAKQAVYSYDPYSRIVSSNTFGIFVKGENSGYTMSVGYHNNDDHNHWWDFHREIGQKPTLDEYHHYVYVYNAEESKLMFYYDGECLAEYGDITIAPGKRLAIGGYPYESGLLGHPYEGSVAMTRIYNDAMTAEQAQKRYETAMILPESETAISKPLYDVQFNSDRTAVNAGSYTGLAVESLLNEYVTVKSVAGFGNVVNFGRGVSNDRHADGFYNSDFSADETFKAMLNDGFTMEMLVSSDAFAAQSAGYARPFGSQSFGVLRQDNGTNEWMPYWNYKGIGAPGTWYYGMDGYAASRRQVNVVTEVNKYAHILYTYKPEYKYVIVYINGEWVGSAHVDALYSGTRLTIGGYPMTDENGAYVTQIWNGDVAVARIYDEVFDAHQSVARYNAMKSTIQTLEAAK